MYIKRNAILKFINDVAITFYTRLFKNYWYLLQEKSGVFYLHFQKLLCCKLFLQVSIYYIKNTGGTTTVHFLLKPKSQLTCTFIVQRWKKYVKNIEKTKKFIYLNAIRRVHYFNLVLGNLSKNKNKVFF